MDVVQRLIKKHRTNNPWRIASQKKIVVLYEDLGKNVWGYFACVNRIRSIHINSRLGEFDKLFAGCHELGHSVLHRGINTPFLKSNTLYSVNKIEREANKFAIDLLVGTEYPENGETKQAFLLRCGIPEEFHIFY